MKVSELFEEKMSDYTLRLIQRVGITRLGKGAYANVFQHPTYGNVVVKVYTDRDKVYKKYITWCNEHQGNPYVPRIASMEEHKSPKGDAYNFVFMEKMKPLSEQRFSAWLQRVFSIEALQAYRDDDLYTLRDEMSKVIKKSKDKKLQEVWAHIMTYPKAQFDVHAGNVMMRDEHIVFSDPVGATPDGPRVDDAH